MLGSLSRWGSALVALIALLGSDAPAHALSCAPFSLERWVTLMPNVVVAEVVSIKKAAKTGDANWHVMKILKVLKGTKLFAPGQRQFLFPDRSAWDRFSYPVGTILLFFFGDYIAIKCNFPVVLRRPRS